MQTGIAGQYLASTAPSRATCRSEVGRLVCAYHLLMRQLHTRRRKLQTQVKCKWPAQEALSLEGARTPISICTPVTHPVLFAGLANLHVGGSAERPGPRAPQAPPPIRILARAPKGPEPPKVVPVEAPVEEKKKKPRHRVRGRDKARVAEVGAEAVAGGSQQPRGGGSSRGARGGRDQGKFQSLSLQRKASAATHGEPQDFNQPAPKSEN